MAESITHDMTNNDVHDQDFDGGLNVKADPTSVKPPQTTRADNVWYVTPGQVRQLPAFATQNILPGRSVYNVGTRDALAPATKGDVLICAESGPPTAQSTSRWYHNIGNTRTNALSAPPYTLITRPHATSVSPTSNGNTMDPNATGPVFARQEVPATGKGPLWATFCGDVTGIRMQSCYADAGGDILMSNPLPITLAYNQFAAIGVAGTSYCAVASQSGTALTVTYLNFDGSVNKTALTATSYVSVSTSSTYVPFDFVTVNNTTYFIYPASSTTINVINLATGGGTTGLGTVASGGPFAAFAATTHTQASQAFFFLVSGGKIYDLQVTSAGNINLFGRSATLPVPTYPSSSTGFLYATGAANILDTQGGVTSAASYAISVFHSYNERLYQTTGTTALGDYAQVSASNITWTQSGGFGTFVANPFRTVSGATLASKAFCAAPPESGFAGPTQSRAAYCAVRCGSTEPLITNLSSGSYGQPTYFLIDHAGTIVSRWGDNAAPTAALYASTYNATSSLPVGYLNQLSTPYYSNANTTPTDISLLDIAIPGWYLADAKFAISATVAVTNQAPYVITNPTPLTPKWLPLVALFSTPNQLALPPCVQQGNSSQMSGPMTLIHDGAVAVEAGYHTATNNLICTAAPTSATGIYTTALGVSGTYYFVACWRWVDAQGRIHRSAPSLPFTLAQSTSNYYGATFVIPFPLSQRTLAETQPVCELYRTVTAATDGIYYFVGAGQNAGWYATGATSVPLTTTSQGAASFGVTINDVTITNANLTSQPRLYTAYNANAAAATYVATSPPPFVWQVGSKGRIFGLACVQGQWRLYYSNISAYGIAPEYNPYNYAPVPPDIGTPRSIEAMDDKIIVIGSQALAVMNGDGPAASNSVGVPNPGDGFSLVVPLPQPAGAYGSGSPVRLPSGIAYQSVSGVQAIARDLTQTPIGAPVDPITGRQVNNQGQPFGRACFLPSLQSIVWCNTTGAPLVYNYMMQKWSVWPLLTGAQSMVQRLDGTVWSAMQAVSGTQVQATADLGTLGATFSFSSTGPTPGTVAMVIETPWIQVGTTQFGEGELYEMQLGGNWFAPHAITIEQAYNYNVYNQFKPSKVLAVPVSPANYQFRVRPVATSRVWAVRYRFTLTALPAGTYNGVTYAAGSLTGSGYNLATLSDMVLSFANKQGASRISAASSR